MEFMQMANKLLRCGLGWVLAGFATLALAEDVSIVGLFSGKAVLVIDGGAPRTLAVGQAIGRVKLVEVGKDAATVEINGRRAKIGIGEPVSVGPTSGALRQITLVADVRGHFLTNGAVNGSGVKFMVDTGASAVSMDTATAIQAGIDVSKGQTISVSTANGSAQKILVKLDRVTVGDVTLYNVDGIVGGPPMPFALLGMSFLNRMEMRRDGSTMVLTQRY
ncbi:TIGR02281 family clan AA aspartic protease [Uliginosibacterium flavum]|uniref:TIGR02281 family clan AA aspartic protease n=1 Tax=Uliginosibacterium flavum TaxID=1396831 RepID=A0ABV2TFV2_9RHOO